MLWQVEDAKKTAKKTPSDEPTVTWKQRRCKHQMNWYTTQGFVSTGTVR
jgi:hypothetical protein